ncbi:hypothetical protein D477_008083 [Arthrobacter crystallopoietes BAB-32]|uniref:Uncharacterized protein n=1 Tax=Arthrobacter crystallopoietes BAB-32 TaxID=1246476 RepID=N1UWE7_9MICC|nr:hypothetical protein D477_008083 [Arthrobacter crystallopoietes BAB-32]
MPRDKLLELRLEARGGHFTPDPLGVMAVREGRILVRAAGAGIDDHELLVLGGGHLDALGEGGAAFGARGVGDKYGHVFSLAAAHRH